MGGEVVIERQSIEIGILFAVFIDVDIRLTRNIAALSIPLPLSPDPNPWKTIQRPSRLAEVHYCKCLLYVLLAPILH